jgi:hypothetical protein
MRTTLLAPGVLLVSLAFLGCDPDYTQPNNQNPSGSDGGQIRTDGGSTTGTDTTAPTFSGLTSATATGSNVTLGWTAATDNSAAASAITYRVFRSTTAGGQVFTSPTATTSPGATTHSLTGLAAGTHYFVVRAVDDSGNEDKNTVEKSATVAVTTGDTTPPTMSGTPTVAPVLANTQASAGSLLVSWTAGTDNVSTAGQLKYQLCVATTATGCDTFNAVQTTLAGVTTATLTGLTPRTLYHVSVRAQDAAANIQAAPIKGQGTTAISYELNINQGIFLTAPSTGGCTGCHTEGYDQWVNVAGSAGCSSMTLIKPGDAANSLVYRKMAGTASCGVQMPKDGTPNSAKIQTMMAWINQGAYKN